MKKTIIISISIIICIGLSGILLSSARSVIMKSGVILKDNVTISTGYLVGFINQRYQRYDDWNCSANNAEATGSCASGDEEYAGEESTWTKTAEGGTARNVIEGTMTKTLTSNKVYQDSITSLYWTDEESSITNEFTYNSTAPDDITESCQFLYTGATTTDASFNAKCDYNADAGNNVSANEFCLNLCLDADNADSDSDGATGMECDWRLPSQKELMQAYINGAANNLPTPNQFFWASTEYYNSTAYAWRTLLHTGYTLYNTKVTGNYVRCVRR